MTSGDAHDYQVGPQDVRFNRGLALVAFIASAYFAVVAVSRLRAGQHTFTAGAAVSIAVTLAIAASYLTWCSMLLMRNTGRPTTWFRDRERNVASWVNAAIFGVGPVLGLAVLLAYAGGAVLLSGLLIGPAGLLLLIALGRVTGGIRPL